MILKVSDPLWNTLDILTDGLLADILRSGCHMLTTCDDFKQNVIYLRVKIICMFISFFSQTQLTLSTVWV